MTCLGYCVPCQSHHGVIDMWLRHQQNRHLMAAIGRHLIRYRRESLGSR